MNQKHQKTLRAIFTVPTSAAVKFSDIEKLLAALGASVIEGSNSRVALIMPNNFKWEAYRPFLGKEAKKYQVESVRKFLDVLNVKSDE